MNNRFRTSHMDKDEFQRDIAGPRPTIVKAGCAPPVAEPIIVAEYFVPLCDDEEEDDEEESKAESVKIPAVSKEIEKNNLNKRTALAPFDWSAASARMEKNRNPEKIKETEWLPPMTTVVLSQEIISPRKEMASSGNKSLSKPLDRTEGFIREKSAPSPSLMNLTGNITTPSDKINALKEKMLIPVSRYVSQEISSVPDLVKTEPVLQRTLIQISQNRASGDREEKMESPEVSPKDSVTATHNPSSEESFLPPTLVQILWFLGVFFLVHHILKIIRVGPIMGFFGATGPEAIGYWSVIEAIVDFFFFRIL
ncbi:unnamed protein product [Hymenolepis diminuta]|nr:unnamed protein product [Hymenolepis diminuta]